MYLTSNYQEVYVVIWFTVLHVQEKTNIENFSLIYENMVNFPNTALQYKKNHKMP